MANHYGAGWVTQGAASLDAAEQAAYEQFRQLAPVAATRNVLLPVGARPRDPVPLGHRHPPGLEQPLRLAPVRDRGAVGVLRRGAQGRGRARRLDHAADQGHEPGVHRQGRVLHRHQAGAAGRRGRGAGRRAAGHAGLAGRGRLSRGRAGQGLAPAGVRRAPRRDHRHRGRPGLPRPAGRVAGGARARRRGPRARPPPTWPGWPPRAGVGRRRGQDRPGGRGPWSCSTRCRCPGPAWPGSRWLAPTRAPRGPRCATTRASPCLPWPRAWPGTRTAPWPR